MCWTSNEWALKARKAFNKKSKRFHHFNSGFCWGPTEFWLNIRGLLTTICNLTGTAGGWPYITSWLKETPDPKRWPSGEVLDQLGSCLPARTPVQLFGALYAALTCPKLALTSAKSLPRIERIVAKAMSPFFHLQKVEEAIPQIKEMAASGGAITDRFEVVLESMNLALELKEATNNSSGQPSQTWRSFQQKILAKLAATKTSKSWQHLATLEADFAEELKKSVEQNLKIAMEHEEEVRQKQQLLQQGQAQEHLEQSRQNLLAVLREDGLKDKTQTGLKKCLAKMKHLHEAMQKVEVPSPYCSEAWNLGRAAVQQFSETRLRCSKAFKWLQDKQLGFCARLLDSCGLLEQLHLLRLESQKVKMVGWKLRIHWIPGMPAWIWSCHSFWSSRIPNFTQFKHTRHVYPWFIGTWDFRSAKKHQVFHIDVSNFYLPRRRRMHCPKTFLVQSWTRYRRAGSQDLKLQNPPLSEWIFSLCVFAKGEWLCQCLERKFKKLISYPSIRYHQSHNEFKLYMWNISIIVL